MAVSEKSLKHVELHWDFFHLKHTLWRMHPLGRICNQTFYIFIRKSYFLQRTRNLIPKKYRYQVQRIWRWQHEKQLSITKFNIYTYISIHKIFILINCLDKNVSIYQTLEAHFSRSTTLNKISGFTRAVWSTHFFTKCNTFLGHGWQHGFWISKQQKCIFPYSEKMCFCKLHKEQKKRKFFALQERNLDWMYFLRTSWL